MRHLLVENTARRMSEGKPRRNPGGGTRERKTVLNYLDVSEARSWERLYPEA